MNAHLTDQTLNEYLDHALAGPSRADVEAHLAGCAVCASRLKALGALFANLEAMPEAPLQRDLRLGVLAAVRARHPAELRPIADPRRPAFRVVFAAQALATLALLAFAWPFVAGLPLPAAPIIAIDLGALAAPVTGGWLDPSRFGLVLPAWLAPVAVWPIGTSAALSNPVVAGLGLLAAGVFWLLGNSLLLRRRQPPRLRRDL